MRRAAAVLLAVTVTVHLAPTAFAQSTATVSGTAFSSSGRALANFTAQLRNAQTGRLIDRTMGSASGSFSFTRVAAASYVVEVLDPAGRVIGTSAVTAVAPGSNVAVAVQAPTGGGGSGGINMAVLLTALAGGAGVAAIIMTGNDESSPSR